MTICKKTFIFKLSSITCKMNCDKMAEKSVFIANNDLIACVELLLKMNFKRIKHANSFNCDKLDSCVQ